ncbi:MAG: lipase maturation factor family protein [Gemmatimonadaceae bacterium]
MGISFIDRISSRADGQLWPRWLFLRVLGLIFLSAFYSLAFQIRGLIGERGILPTRSYLQQLSGLLGAVEKVWYAPTLFWLNSSDAALTTVVVLGSVASILLVCNVAPRAMIAVSTILFLTCIAALQDFSWYQSDGMLMEAGFISFFFAPGGLRPGLGATYPPSRISLFMLEWEWFRIYFESGLVKILSGDPTWRNLTAMDQYYQNGPLPAWPGWYVQHWPHWYHAGTVILTLFVELLLVWALFLPRRIRIGSFFIFTALQIGIISTGNYAFLNYLVLCLGVLLLDDRFLARFGFPLAETRAASPTRGSRIFRRVETAVLSVAFYSTIVAFLWGGSSSILALPNRLLAPFRIANPYGLFAVMTPARYEIEFQGSSDGRAWVPYQFRYKPQDVFERPGIYAPYQPRFEWNLWFASLAPWQQNPWVVNTEQRLIEGSPSVLGLFRGDPFHGKPPAMVRTIIYQYWFTDLATRRSSGAWWRREELGQFSPSLSALSR